MLPRRRTADRQHVVDAHDGVGHDDGAQRGGEGSPPAPAGMLVRGVLIGLSSLRAIQIRATPPASMKPGTVEDVDDQDGHQGAHRDGAEGAPEDHLALPVLGQVARDQADDQGVVARQHEVDQDNGEQGRQEAGRKKFGHDETPTKKTTEGLGRLRSEFDRHFVDGAAGGGAHGSEEHGREKALKAAMPPAITAPARRNWSRCQ